jgi:TPR repeat protein
MTAATAAAQAQNYALAAQLLEPLAEQDDPLALYNLAVLYAAGQGVPRDLQRAFMLTERSARKGFVSAQNNLGVMYLKGIGVTPDRKQALHWLNVAAANGHPLAKRSLEALENQNVMPDGTK